MFKEAMFGQFYFQHLGAGFRFGMFFMNVYKYTNNVFRLIGAVYMRGLKPKNLTSLGLKTKYRPTTYS